MKQWYSLFVSIYSLIKFIGWAGFGKLTEKDWPDTAQGKARFAKNFVKDYWDQESAKRNAHKNKNSICVLSLMNVLGGKLMKMCVAGE